jgi:signal transduction histidine kinase
MNLLNTSTFGFAFVVATLLFLLLSCFIILLLLLYKKHQNQHRKEMVMLKNTYEQALLQSQVEVQEATFSTLGKELHDNLGQLLSTAKMLINVTSMNLENVPDSLNTADETISKALSELRSLSKTLNKEWLSQFDLIENLKREIARINTSKTVQVHLEECGKLYLDPDKQIILFRIIQEAIQNSIKHASAENGSIKLDGYANPIEITVVDDGVGFHPSGKTDGVGILNMKQRTKSVGGTLQIQSYKDKGTTILIQLPI